MAVNKASYELFRALIDYAGMFPPANLSLEDSIEKYRNYLDSEFAWILSNFILATNELSKISNDSLALFSNDFPLRLSLLTNNLIDDYSAMLKVVESNKGRVVLGAVETKLHGPVDAQLTLHESVLSSLTKEIMIFYEVPGLSTSNKGLAEVVNALSTKQCRTAQRIGLKLRCGGTKPSDVPSIETVADCLLLCGDKNVPIKFTAGLHHPFRNFNKSVGTTFHGYFNIFFASLLIATEKTNISTIYKVLSEEKDTNVRVTDAEVSWLGFDISLEEIAYARKNRCISYGSCSFTEPIEDAQKLGWI